MDSLFLAQQERLVQACKCVVLAYADREEHAMGLELSLPGLDHSALEEEVKETTALVILALRCIMYISEGEVRRSSRCFVSTYIRRTQYRVREFCRHEKRALISRIPKANSCREM